MPACMPCFAMKHGSCRGNLRDRHVHAGLPSTRTAMSEAHGSLEHPCNFGNGANSCPRKLSWMDETPSALAPGRKPASVTSERAASAIPVQAIPPFRIGPCTQTLAFWHDLSFLGESDPQGVRGMSGDRHDMSDAEWEILRSVLSRKHQGPERAMAFPRRFGVISLRWRTISEAAFAPVGSGSA